jgi:hypothetical protein
MYIHVDKTGTVTGFQDILQTALADDAVKGLLILACDANGFTPEAIDETLQAIPLPVMGGVFPELISGQDKLTKGSIIAGLTTAPHVQTIPGLSDESVDFDALIDEKFPKIGSAKTMFVFVDGLATRIASLIDSLFNIFGLELNYVGGGAGSLSFVQKPCIFTNDGLVQDSAQLALAELDSGIGVSHGWQTISGPFTVTEVARNVIKSLDWQPAFDVYRQVVEEASGQTFTGDNFFDIAKGYPFGINKIGAEKIVRDPITATEEGALVCVGEVPEGSVVDSLAGDKDSLINAAKNAMQQGKASYESESGGQSALFIDCISRVLFLEDDFEMELAAVHDDNLPLIGALTLGEIANSGDDYLEFYNKTAVIAVLG